MNILLVSTPNPYKTSGIVAYDLLNAFKKIQGVNVKLVVKEYGNYPDEDVISVDTFFIHYKIKVFRKIKQLLMKLNLINSPEPSIDYNYSVHDYDQTATYYSTEGILGHIDFKVDLIIVLFTHNFLSHKNLFELNKKTDAPILLYLMDMAPMTGGCHYAWNCQKYTEICGFCPALYSCEQNDQAMVNFIFKKEFIERTHLVPIAGSEWQFSQLAKSSLYASKNKAKILLAINESLYCPSDKMKSRKKLGLPEDKKILFFGAVSMAEKRKGVKELIEALKRLKIMLPDPDQIHLAVAGRNRTKGFDFFPFPSTYLGYLDHNDLPKAFQAADIFLSPSIEDSGPMMVNQSIMCGTPVVAFEIGVALDIIHNLETGFRVKLKDTGQFAAGILSILKLSSEDYLRMSQNCRELGLKRFKSTVVADNFMKIYNENRP